MLVLVFIVFYLCLYCFLTVHITRHLSGELDKKRVVFSRFKNDTTGWRPTQVPCNLADQLPCNNASVHKNKLCKCVHFERNTKIHYLDKTTQQIAANTSIWGNVSNVLKGCNMSKFGDVPTIYEYMPGKFHWQCSCRFSNFFTNLHNDRTQPCRNYLGCPTTNSLPFDPVVEHERWTRIGQLECNCNDQQYLVKSPYFAPYCKTANYFFNTTQTSSPQYSINSGYLNEKYVLAKFGSMANFIKFKKGLLPNPCFYDFLNKRFINETYINLNYVEIARVKGVVFCRSKHPAFVTIRFTRDYLAENDGRWANGMIQVAEVLPLLQQPTKRIFEWYVLDTRFNATVNLEGRIYSADGIFTNLKTSIAFLNFYVDPFNVNLPMPIKSFHIFNAPEYNFNLKIDNTLGQLYQQTFHRIFIEGPTGLMILIFLGVGRIKLEKSNWNFPIDLGGYGKNFKLAKFVEPYARLDNWEHDVVKHGLEYIGTKKIGTIDFQVLYEKCMKHINNANHWSPEQARASCTFMNNDLSLIPAFYNNNGNLSYTKKCFYYTGLFEIDTGANIIRPIAPNKLSMLPKYKKIVGINEPRQRHYATKLHFRYFGSASPAMSGDNIDASSLVFNCSLFNIPPPMPETRSLVNEHIECRENTFVVTQDMVYVMRDDYLDHLTEAIDSVKFELQPPDDV